MGNIVIAMIYLPKNKVAPILKLDGFRPRALRVIDGRMFPLLQSMRMFAVDKLNLRQQKKNDVSRQSAIVNWQILQPFIQHWMIIHQPFISVNHSSTIQSCIVMVKDSIACFKFREYTFLYTTCVGFPAWSFRGHSEMLLRCRLTGCASS